MPGRPRRYTDEERKQRHREAVKRWRERNREKYAGIMRKIGRRVAGIHEDDLTGEKRAGPCELCTKAGPLVLDHDHTTGRVRGWLCGGCNSALGMFGDTVDGLRRAIAYLEK